MQVSDNIKQGIPYAVIGAIVPTLVSMNLFAKPSDLEAIKVEMYKTFITREEVNSKFNQIDDKLDKIVDKLYGGRHDQ